VAMTHHHREWSAEPNTIPAVDADGAASRSDTILRRYAVIEPVGRGGMGSVLRAYDPTLKREVALKLVSNRGPGASSPW